MLRRGQIKIFDLEMDGFKTLRITQVKTTRKKETFNRGGLERKLDLALLQKNIPKKSLSSIFT